VLPALLMGEEEQEGMKMGEDEWDIVGQSCGMYRAKGVVRWWTQRGQSAGRVGVKNASVKWG